MSGQRRNIDNEEELAKTIEILMGLCDPAAVEEVLHTCQPLRTFRQQAERSNIASSGGRHSNGHERRGNTSNADGELAALMQQASEIFGDSPAGTAFVQQFMRDHQGSSQAVMQRDFRARLAREEERRGVGHSSHEHLYGGRYGGDCYGGDRHGASSFLSRFDQGAYGGLDDYDFSSFRPGGYGSNGYSFGGYDGGSALYTTSLPGLGGRYNGDYGGGIGGGYEGDYDEGFLGDDDGFYGKIYDGVHDDILDEGCGGRYGGMFGRGYGGGLGEDFGRVFGGGYGGGYGGGRRGY